MATGESLPRKSGFLERIGRTVIRSTYSKMEEIGAASLIFLEGLFPPYFFDLENTIRQFASWGLDALPIATIGCSVGAMILSQLLAQEVVDQGIGSTFIGGIIAIVMTRNLGPILIGIILAGQLGAAVTSEIGSMKISEQVDALKAMGVDPFQYLIVPRLVASVIMTPMVATTAVLISIYLGFFPANHMAHLSWNGYEYSIRTWMQMKFIREMIWKAAVFGFIIALVASYKGLAVREGAADLGKKVTEAVVTCIVFVLLADLLMSVYYFS